MPQFKGRPGWEFTDTSGLDLPASPPAGPTTNGHAAAVSPRPMFELEAVAELRQVDGDEATLTGTLPDGVIVMSLEQAADEHAELVQRHLGTVVDADDVFV